jgi:hypothetical protein
MSTAPAFRRWTRSAVAAATLALAAVPVASARAQFGTGLTPTQVYRPDCGTYLCLVIEYGQITRPSEFGAYVRIASAQPTAALTALGAARWSVAIPVFSGFHVACPPHAIPFGCAEEWVTSTEFLTLDSPPGPRPWPGLFELSFSDTESCAQRESELSCIDEVGAQVSGPASFTARGAQGQVLATETFAVARVLAPDPATVAPEPATLALTAGGLLALAGVAKRRGRG